MRNHMDNTNRLFVALKGADRARLAPHMRRFELLKDAVLYEIGDPIDTLYFPLSGQVALVIVSEDGSETESTSIGNNGVVGLGGLISGDKSFTCQRVQVAGEALSLPRGPFLQVYHESRDLRNAVAAHQDAFTAQLLQSVHCQGNHLVDQRVARWLLSAFELDAGRAVGLDAGGAGGGTRRPARDGDDRLEERCQQRVSADRAGQGSACRPRSVGVASLHLLRHHPPGVRTRHRGVVIPRDSQIWGIRRPN